MADDRFFTKAEKRTLQQIAALSGATLAKETDGTRTICDVAPLERAGEKDVSFIDNVKYLPAFAESKAGACFVRPQHVKRAPTGMALLVTENPYLAYATVAQEFYPDAASQPGISAHAHIAKSAKLG